ncbi:head-tail connector protein [Sphingobium phenoxybenzoativorans]|uniref:Head-tail connector protein n=1 Tax=Sphingobium phenoxybenzoativorans TaxID=1592790 RepID=A0A975K4T6_9SPHN|nr:head-tail connector protein [Sphingobium phenoxybenzoativorans]QUT04838.1 head-tail connector protein [Sphingobium phenoxybenzoativorans]
MGEPLSLQQAKAHLRVDGDDEDDLISSCIVEARGWVEDYTGLILTSRAIVESVSAFDARLRAWPITTLETISYTDTDGLSQTLASADYTAQLTTRPARITAAPGVRFPALLPNTRISVSLTAGFTDAAAMIDFAPNLLRAMKIMLTEYYDNRGAADGGNRAENVAKALCRNLRNWAV